MINNMNNLSIYSDYSRVSAKSQKILENVAKQSTTKYFLIFLYIKIRMRVMESKGIFDDEDIRVCFNAFGLYISR